MIALLSRFSPHIRFNPVSNTIKACPFCSGEASHAAGADYDCAECSGTGIYYMPDRTSQSRYKDSYYSHDLLKSKASSQRKIQQRESLASRWGD